MNITIKITLLLLICSMLFIIIYFYKRQKTLLQENEIFKTLFDDSKNAILIIKDDKIIDCNKSTLKMINAQSKDKLIDTLIYDLSPKLQHDGSVSHEKGKELFAAANKDGSLHFEWLFEKIDGEEFWVDVTLTKMILHDEVIIHALWKDITENKILEYDLEKKNLVLLEQTKIASMGEMIENIAHQWRQPLSIISTLSTGLKIKKEYGILEDKELLLGFEQINENTQYLSQTIDAFRNFISGESKIVRFDLKNDTESFIKLVDSTIQKYHIQLILNLEEDIKVQGYPNELIQCFMNIFNNARDALMENNIAENERYIFITQIIKENNVIITFKDNAGGIPEEVIKKVFEPYFTTKHKSKGTGLGLNMTYNFIVNSMDGMLEVENVNYEFNKKEYKGAQFTITLPLS